MEKELKIKIGKKFIYAKLRGSLKKPVVVLVHGLGGLMDEALHYNAARYFEKYGFASLRFNLYGEEKDARRMRDCTLKIHGKDLDAVVLYLKRKGVKKVFVIGHSYGTPTILHSKKQNLDAVVFWDGSFTERIFKYFEQGKYIKQVNGRLLDWGFDILIGEQMIQEASKVDSLKLMDKFNKPVLFAYAEKGTLVASGRKMYERSKAPKKFIVVKDAQHNFNEDGVQKKLYSETVKWLKNYI